MRVFFYRYCSIVEPDILSAFNELGLDIIEMQNPTLRKNESISKKIKLISDFLLEHPSDFAFSINFFPVLSEICRIFNIPYVCLSVDSPVPEFFSKCIKNECNRVFIFDKEDYQLIAPLNPGNVFHIPLAANVDAFDKRILSASEDIINKFKSEISFVGSLYTEKNPYYDFAPEDKYIEGYLDGIMEAQLNVYGYNFIESMLTDTVVNEFRAHTKNFIQMPDDNFLTDRYTIANHYIGNNISVMERDRTVRLLSEKYDFDIYTNSDTSKYPKLKNKGTANSVTGVPIIFNNSRINMNITAKNIRSGLPQRIWDILGSGGFCLTNYQAEIGEELIPGIHLETYSSMEELEDKLKYYLENENKRKEIAQAGYEEVKAHHTWTIRMAQILRAAL